MALSGFNADVIAEAVPCEKYTTESFDGTTAEGGAVFYNENVCSEKPEGDYWLVLPENGAFTSTASNTPYQLQESSENNALLLSSNNTTGTLTLLNSGCFSDLMICSASASGSSVFSVTLCFNDGSSSVYSFKSADWYGGNPYALNGIGRIYRTTYQFDRKSDSGPRLYENEITLTSEDQQKVLTSIGFERTSGDQALTQTGIFAVTGKRMEGVPASPSAQAASNVVNDGFTANWNAVDDAETYYLEVATDSGFMNSVPNLANKNVGNNTSVSVTGLSPDTTYYYRVRAAKTVGQSANSNTIEVKTTIANIPVQCVHLPDPLLVYTDEHQNIVATINPENATNKKINWSLNSSELASVETGEAANACILTPIKVWSVTLTAVSAENPEISAECIGTIKLSATTVIAEIENLPKITVDDTSKAAIEKAEVDCAMLDAGQKEKVANYRDLQMARRSYDDLVAAKAVEEQIIALPAPESLKYSDKVAVTAVR
ncbi:fibronectin type III domain-containing protein [Eubacterium aggregans]|uniref:fibronectin type III domain-containing protein n=1 Tax=Eubacterium aggregans TaxID=81409 RepID=UPI003F2B8918